MRKINILLIMLGIVSANMVSAQQNNNMNEYKTILKRPVVTNQQDIIDRANIKELVEFERFCRDNRLWDEMKKCYSDDSRVNISWYQGSGHGFVDASAKMEGFVPHKIYNTEVWNKGDKAVAIMMSNIQMRHIIDGYPVEVSSDAKLIFRLQRIKGQWYIVSFESIYEKDAIIPVVPNANINIPAEEIAKYRASYGCMIYMGKRSGMTIDENLPGIDRPDLVEKLYRETDEWLSK